MKNRAGQTLSGQLAKIGNISAILQTHEHVIGNPPARQFCL
jgi:hypothetical protein